MRTEAEIRKQIEMSQEAVDYGYKEKSSFVALSNEIEVRVLKWVLQNY